MNHTIIIAEAGVNHNGSIELAKLLIDEAVESGVDYIKFQTFKSENLVTRTAKQADYQKKNIGDSDNSQYNMLKELELSEEQHFELIEYCNKKGIKFFSTAFDMDSIDFLTSLNLGLWKIPSGELTSYPYVKKIASFGEQHFTLDRNLPGPDHKASLEPSELKAMVSAIRNIEQALGSEEKKVSSSEMKNKAVARKSIVAAKAIKAGEMFSEENLTVKRPGIGISPMKWESVIGQVAIRDFEQDELIEL